MLDIVGDVRGKNVLIVDDFTISGGTLIEMAVACKERGCKDVYACVSHGVFSRGSAAKIAHSPIKELVFTDTIEYRFELSRLLQGHQRCQPLRRRHHVDPSPREREPPVQLLTIAMSSGQDGRVTETLIRDRDRPDARNQLHDETGRNMAWGHLDEEFHTEFARDLKDVVPADRMRDAGRKVLADGFGVRGRAAAAIAHIGHRRRPKRESGQLSLQAIRDRLKQRAMRGDTDRQSFGTVRTLPESQGGHRLEPGITSSDDELSLGIDIGNEDGGFRGPEPDQRSLPGGPRRAPR